MNCSLLLLVCLALARVSMAQLMTHPLTNIPRQHPEVTATYVFPEHADKKLPLGEAVTLLCHVQNHGDTVLNISAIMGSLNNVQDFGFHIQVIVQYTDHQSYPRTALPLP